MLGATGYTGGILLRLLSTHPEVREIIAVSSSQAGQRVRAVDPGLSPAIEQKMGRRGGTLVSLEEAVKAASAGELDVVFSGLPHLKSAEVCGPLLGKTVVIDLSADFRLKDPAVFAKAYGAAMPGLIFPPKPCTDLRNGARSRFGPRTSLQCQAATLPQLSFPSCRLQKRESWEARVIVNAISGVSSRRREREG